MISNRTNFFNLILHLIITTVFSQQTECPWSFRFSLLCSDFNPVLGGDCIWDASEQSITGTVEGQSRCHSNARALCADSFFVGYGSVCFNRCQRFHATCCCPPSTVGPTSTPTVSKRPTTTNPTSPPSDPPTTAPVTTSPTSTPTVSKIPTTAAPTSAPSKTSRPSLATTEKPTSAPVVSPTEQDRCPWTGYEGSCVGYDCKFSAGNGAQVWRCILNSSGGCAATFCPALCTAFHSQCCCPS